MPVDDTPLNANNTVSISEPQKRAHLTGFHGCSVDQVKVIKQAYKDAIMIVKAMGDPENIDFRSVMVKEYFGTDVADERNSEYYQESVIMLTHIDLFTDTSRCR